MILGTWRSYSPEGRRHAVAALLAHGRRVPLLMEAIEDGRVEPSALEPAARSRLYEYPDGAIARKARLLLESSQTDRAKVTAAYHDVLNLSGEVVRGRKIFDDNCARCHTPTFGRASWTGPLRHQQQTKEELLTSILNPSYAIEPRFVNYLVTTRDGRMYDGVIANETPSAITLRGGSEEGDQRKNIADIRASSVSLMPDGLDENLSKQDLSDFVVQDFRLFGNPSGQRQGQGVSGPRGGKDEIFQINESLRTTGGKHTLRVGFTGNRYRDTFPEAMRPVGEHRCLHAARAVAARKCRAQ